MSHDRGEPTDAPRGGDGGPGDETRPIPPGSPDVPDRTQAFDPHTEPDQTRRQAAGAGAGAGAGAWSGRAGVPPPRPAAGTAEPAGWDGYESSGGRPWWMPILIGLLALLLLAALAAAFWFLSESEDRDDPVVPSPSATSRAPSRTPAPTVTTGRPTPSRTSAAPVAMPPLVGLPLRSAQDQLEELGLESRLEFTPSAQTAGTVLDTDPGAGVLVTPGDTVTLLVAQPRRSLPPTPTASGPNSPGP